MATCCFSTSFITLSLYSLQLRPLLAYNIYPKDYWTHPRLWTGLTLFFFGFYVNLTSDHQLQTLRSTKQGNNKRSGSYKIPTGGWFDLVSTPHYFGEIVEWTGFAIATNMQGAWVFVLFTAANLVPRGLAHHEWYKVTFGKEYPRHRKAIIPWIL
jgi:steroid 5-alpha reductase family enzyme